MPTTFFQPLAKASVATLSADLAILQQAQKAGLRTAPTHVTQSACFARLIEDRELFADMTKNTLETTTAVTKILQKISAITLPKAVTQELHQLYHHDLDGGFVRLRCWTQYGDTPWISEIVGDANVLESLLSAWSAGIELNVQHGSSLVEAVTNCQAVIQAQPPAPVACGELFTRHPDTGESHIQLIRLWPGAPHPALHTEQPSQYAVDIRTNLIVQRQVGASHQRAKRTPDKVVLEPRSETAEFLDEAEVQDLVREMTGFKRQYLKHLHATFEVQNDQLVFTDLREQIDERMPVTQPQQLITKVYVATGSADSLDITGHENSDGIGLLRAEYVFARLETHPLTLLKRGRTAIITDRLSNFLSEANQSYPHRRIVYRLQNFTSQELRGFKTGESQEKEEPNPYLGWRGGLRLMEQPQLFEPELETFAKWLKRRRAPTGLLVPFVRSTAEWRWIINRWKERQFFDQPEFENWFQITTPENINNLDGYILSGVHGISLNIRTVTALMTGIDPDDAQLQASYPPPIELQQTIIAEVGQRVAHLREQNVHAKLRLHLHLEDYNHSLVSSAVKLRYDGIVLHPAALTIGRSCIGSTEHDLAHSARTV